MSYSTRNYASLDNFVAALTQCSLVLQDATIYASDFSFITPKSNDFVYFDPPYHKSGEKFYTRLPFSEDDQIRLRNFALELSNKGVKLMLSNSDTDFIRDLSKALILTLLKLSILLPTADKSQPSY